METNDVEMAGVKVVRTEPMALARQAVDVADMSQRGLDLFRERVRVARESLSLALKLTQPGQWIVMVSPPGKDGKEKVSVYASAGAADRILRSGYGMRWGEKVVTIASDGLSATCRAPLLQASGEVYETFEGARAMGGYVKNERDLVKAACANMMHRAVTEILGLRMLSPADFKELGLDLSTLERRVEYQDHTGNREAGGVVMSFGKQKGVPLSQVTDADLAWYAEALAKNVADPEKARWKADNQAKLAAIVTEQDARKAKADAPLISPEDETPWALIRKAAAAEGLCVEPGKDQDLRHLVKKVTGKGRPSDLTAEDIGKIQAALVPPEPGAEG